MTHGIPSAIVILTAVELEAAALARQLDLFPLASFPFRVFGRRGLSVAPVGLRAHLLAERWASLTGGLARPLVISAGLCGALDPRLRVGDLVVPDCVLGPSGERFDLDAPEPRRAVLGAATSAHEGSLVTTREVAATAGDKAGLRARTGAIAVDMESAAIVGRAREAGCPALVVRGVSDSARDDLPAELIRLLRDDGRIGVGGAVALAFTRPRTLVRGIALGRGARRALATVGRALAALTRGDQ